jgi:hypothetical protein
MLKLGMASWCTNHVLRSRSNGTLSINSSSYFSRKSLFTSLLRVQEIHKAYWKITNITPDIGAKLLLVVLFDSCLRVFFCSDTNIIAVDNNLSIKGSLISVQYNTAERRLTQHSLSDITEFSAVARGSPWAQCPTLLRKRVVHLLLLHDLPNCGVRCINRSMNAIVAQPKNCHTELILRLSSKYNYTRQYLHTC